MQFAKFYKGSTIQQNMHTYISSQGIQSTLVVTQGIIYKINFMQHKLSRFLTVGTSGRTGLKSSEHFLLPDVSFAVSATSPLGSMPSANHTLFCSLEPGPKMSWKGELCQFGNAAVKQFQIGQLMFSESFCYSWQVLYSQGWNILGKMASIIHVPRAKSMPI